MVARARVDQALLLVAPMPMLYGFTAGGSEDVVVVAIELMLHKFSEAKLEAVVGMKSFTLRAWIRR